MHTYNALMKGGQEKVQVVQKEKTSCCLSHHFYAPYSDNIFGALDYHHVGLKRTFV